LAVIALVGQLASFAHLVLVRHVTCAEHGELVELGRDRPMVATVSRRHVPMAVADASSAGGHGHDHCLIAPMRRDRLAIGTPASLDSTHIEAYGTIGYAGDDGLASPIALILLAPKNSPPLA
jgi:hypothetical protein